MSRVLPRRQESEVVKTMVLRPRNPDDHRDFQRVLPWFTPLFVWRGPTFDWIRWSVPTSFAARMGLVGACACCGEDTTARGENGDYLIDTAWHEVSWFLEANDYTINTPTEKEEESS